MMTAKIFSSVNRICVKRSKLISILLVIVVFWVGVCSDTVAEHSPSLCTLTEQIEYRTYSDDVAISNIKFCIAEMLGGYNNICIQQIIRRQIEENREIRYLLDLSYLNIFSMMSYKFFTISEMVHSCDMHKEETVLNYIHRSDGKKRI